jgi:hypothetical protein
MAAGRPAETADHSASSLAWRRHPLGHLLSSPLPWQPAQPTRQSPVPAANLSAAFGDVAQLAERYLCKVDVRGSIPLVSTEERPVQRLFLESRSVRRQTPGPQQVHRTQRYWPSASGLTRTRRTVACACDRRVLGCDESVARASCHPYRACRMRQSGGAGPLDSSARSARRPDRAGVDERRSVSLGRVGGLAL